MRQPAHTIRLEPWKRHSFGNRVIIQTAAMTLWALKPDDRMSVLLTLLADQISDVAENEIQIDAIIDALRAQLKYSLHESPPTQNWW